MRWKRGRSSVARGSVTRTRTTRRGSGPLFRPPRALRARMHRCARPRGRSCSDCSRGAGLDAARRRLRRARAGLRGRTSGRIRVETREKGRRVRARLENCLTLRPKQISQRFICESLPCMNILTRCTSRWFRRRCRLRYTSLYFRTKFKMQMTNCERVHWVGYDAHSDALDSALGHASSRRRRVRSRIQSPDFPNILSLARLKPPSPPPSSTSPACNKS